jgi:hypothetical protein
MSTDADPRKTARAATADRAAEDHASEDHAAAYLDLWEENLSTLARAGRVPAAAPKEPSE